jgi:hypothetical protein
MEIRFVSTLTADEEERVVNALPITVASLLEQLPITYALRIETATNIFEFTNLRPEVANEQPSPHANSVSSAI